MSLSQYINSRESEPQQLWWGRVRHDGLPLRGAVDPMLTEAEADERLDTAIDAHSRFFDLADPAQEKEYTQLVDQVVNGLGMFLKHEHVFLKSRIPLADGGWREDVAIKVFAVWALGYMEDTKRVEHSHG